MKKNIVVLFLIVILSTALIAGCNNQAPTGNVVNTKTEEFIKIGYIGPLTGDVAYIGEGVGNTVQLAVEEVNAAGGINGKKIKLILEDGKCNNKDAANAANKLVYVDKVGFIIGGGCSSETLGAAPIVENSKTGKLFVITGRAKNEYSKARGVIKITGKLFTKGKKLAQTKTVFCGNVISDLDLATKDLDIINKRLANRFGDNKSNAKVRPNKTIPFMIVFSKLPNNLEEFTINVVGSTPIK